MKNYLFASKYFLILLVFFLVIGFIGVKILRTTSGSQEEIIAKINGEPILFKEFLEVFQSLKNEQDDISVRNPKVLDQLKTRALNEVIVKGILKTEAQRKQIKIAKEEIDGRLANWKDSFPPGEFEAMLSKQNISEETLKKKIEDQLLIEKITSELFGAETLVSDEELKKYFNDHEQDFSRPERVHVFQIVVPTKEEALKLKQEISTDKITFESAARQFSLSPDAAKGGDLGFFARNEKIAAFNEAFSLKLGALSKPIQSRYGFHLLKVVEKQPAKRLTFLEAKQDIVKAIRKTKEIKVYKEWVSKLLKDGEIYRNEVLFSNAT